MSIDPTNSSFPIIPPIVEETTKKVIDATTTTDVGSWFSGINLGVVDTISGIGSSIGNSVYNVGSATYNGVYNAGSTTINGISNGLGYAWESTAIIRDPITSTVKSYTDENSVLGSSYTFVAGKVGNTYAFSAEKAGNAYAYGTETISNLGTGAVNIVAEQALTVKYTVAAAGGVYAINSAMNILQQRHNIDRNQEIKKIVAGTAAVALSLYTGNTGELAAIGLSATGAGLTTALYKASTYAKKNLVMKFSLKSKDASPAPQNVVQITPSKNAQTAAIAV